MCTEFTVVQSSSEEEPSSPPPALNVKKLLVLLEQLSTMDKSTAKKFRCPIQWATLTMDLLHVRNRKNYVFAYVLVAVAVHRVYEVVVGQKVFLLSSAKILE